jgi:hypothetical protein
VTNLAAIAPGLLSLLSTGWGCTPLGGALLSSHPTAVRPALHCPPCAFIWHWWNRKRAQLDHGRMDERMWWKSGLQAGKIILRVWYDRNKHIYPVRGTVAPPVFRHRQHFALK